MKFIESFVMAMKSLSSNKMRSLLTMLGIIIGVGAVISLMSIGRGTQSMITSQFESMGTNLMYVMPGSTSQSGVRTAAGTAQTLTLEDAEAIADPANAPAVAMTAPEIYVFGQVVAGSQNMNTRVIGATPDYQYVRNFPVAEGDFITQRDVDARSTVVVLGADAASTLFPGTDAIDAVGQSLKINRRQFRVIGVLERKGGTIGVQQDNAVVVPLTTARYRLFSQRTGGGGLTVQTIYVQAVSKDAIPAAIDQVRAILRERHRLTGDDDFTITSMSDIVASLNQIMAVFTIFLGSIAGISLLVGSIGIMNIMLVSVTERTREIGIRKAIGAKRRDILGQFLIEAITMSLAGGIIGVLFGWGTSTLINRLGIQGMTGQPMQTLVTPDIIILALTVSAAIGVFSGVYPAFRAARLDPIVALRYE